MGTCALMPTTLKPPWCHHTQILPRRAGPGCPPPPALCSEPHEASGCCGAAAHRSLAGGRGARGWGGGSPWAAEEEGLGDGDGTVTPTHRRGLHHIQATPSPLPPQEVFPEGLRGPGWCSQQCQWRPPQSWLLPSGGRKDRCPNPSGSLAWRWGQKCAVLAYRPSDPAPALAASRRPPRPSVCSQRGHKAARANLSGRGPPRLPPPSPAPLRVGTPHSQGFPAAQEGARPTATRTRSGGCTLLRGGLLHPCSLHRPTEGKAGNPPHGSSLPAGNSVPTGDPVGGPHHPALCTGSGRAQRLACAARCPTLGPGTPTGAGTRGMACPRPGGLSLRLQHRTGSERGRCAHSAPGTGPQDSAHDTHVCESSSHGEAGGRGPFEPLGRSQGRACGGPEVGGGGLQASGRRCRGLPVLTRPPVLSEPSPATLSGPDPRHTHSGAEGQDPSAGSHYSEHRAGSLHC